MEQFYLCCVLTYEVVHIRGKRRVLRITVLIPKIPAWCLKSSISTPILDLLLIVRKTRCTFVIWFNDIGSVSFVRYFKCTTAVWKKLLYKLGEWRKCWMTRGFREKGEP